MRDDERLNSRSFKVSDLHGFVWRDCLDLVDALGRVRFTRLSSPPAAPFSLTSKKMGEKKTVAQAPRRAGTAQIAPVAARKLLPCVPWRGHKVRCWTEPCAARDGSREVGRRSEWGIRSSDQGHKGLRDCHCGLAHLEALLAMALDVEGRGNAAVSKLRCTRGTAGKVFHRAKFQNFYLFFLLPFGRSAMI